MKAKYLIGLVVGIVVAIVAVTYALTTQQIYVTFEHAVDKAGQVQVRGTWVKEKGAEYNPNENRFEFTLRDESGETMPVVYNDAKPNNFELAEEVVVGGRVENGVFKATSLLTKCPSKYEADRIDV